MWPEITLGVDLAQSQDFSALVGLEHRPGMQGTTYATRMIERWRGRSYTELPRLVHQAETKLRQTIANEFFDQHGSAIHPWHDVGYTLVVDATGVGAPVVDALNDAGLQPVPIIITGGFEVNSREGGGYAVPKSDLVAAVQLLLEQHRLLIPKDLPHAATLTSELASFRYEIGATGHVRYGAGPVGSADRSWRGDGSHDDLLLATAVAAWHAEKNQFVGISEELLRAFSGMPGTRW